MAKRVGLAKGAPNVLLVDVTGSGGSPFESTRREARTPSSAEDSRLGWWSCEGVALCRPARESGLVEEDRFGEEKMGGSSRQRFLARGRRLVSAQDEASVKNCNCTFYPRSHSLRPAQADQPTPSFYPSSSEEDDCRGHAHPHARQTHHYPSQSLLFALDSRSLLTPSLSLSTLRTHLPFLAFRSSPPTAAVRTSPSMSPSATLRPLPALNPQPSLVISTF